MASLSTKTKETSMITYTPQQKFEGHTNSVYGVIHLPDGQQIITCSYDGSLRVWNLESGRQMGEDWRDGESRVLGIALSLDGRKVVSGSDDGAVRLWDINTCKVITKWMGHAHPVESVCWSRDGRRVLSGSWDGSARQWDVESGETILELILTGHRQVHTVVYSPDMTLIATGGCGCVGPEPHKLSVKIWDAKTGELVTTLQGHKWDVTYLAWTTDGKMLISGSYDHSIRTWNTTNWQQTAVLDEHTNSVRAIAISPNGRILASASRDNTARLWNLENGQLINVSPLQHASPANCLSFSADGKLLATGCDYGNAYSWDVTAIIKEASLDDLLSDPKAKKSALRINATRPPIQVCPPVNRIPQGFFDGVPTTHFSAQRPNPPDSTFLSRLFHRSPSTAHDTSSSSPLDWARNLSKWRERSDEVTELQRHNPAVVKVPYAKGKRRNACAREQRKAIKLPSKNSTSAGSSQPPKPNITQPSSQPQVSHPSSSTTPVTGDATAATTLTPLSRYHATIRDVGLWTRFWLFIGCISPEYTDSNK